jgi:hypothetical protein
VEEGDPTGSAVDQRRPDIEPELSVAERATGDCGRASQLLRAAVPAEIGAEDDIGVEHRHKLSEVAVTRSQQKRVDDLPLRLDVGVGNGSLGADAPARAAGELAGRLGGALDNRRDLIEGHAEDVVQHEREPLRRRQRLEHDEQREPDGIGEERLVLRIDSVRSIEKQVREPPGERLVSAALRERSMFSEIRATTVVSQAPRFSSSIASVRFSLSHASCTASSASLSEPSIR